MAVNPTEWLSSSMSACCKKFFGGYMYDSCMGRYPPDHDDCNTMLYYPNWGGTNEGCVDDGQEPYYMLSNHQYFLSNTREECCKKFYEWDFYTCTGTMPELTNGEFYPDWSGGGTSTCRADGKIPDYMISNQKWYLSTTLKKCCERHFYWDINECLGTTAVGTDKWYANYEDAKCVQDCSGASPCGGVANFWEELYSTKEQCCKTKLGWLLAQDKGRSKAKLIDISFILLSTYHRDLVRDFPRSPPLAYQNIFRVPPQTQESFRPQSIPGSIGVVERGHPLSSTQAE
eukprot:scaffold20142_cov80-Skeletonema_dohrnii-CCMP3373.AAC.3